MQGLTGIQISFFMFAVLLLAVPLGRWIATYCATPETSPLLQRVIPFILFALLVVAMPPLRRSARRLLAIPIPMAMRTEVTLVALAIAGLGFATVGARALWCWITQGESGLSALRMDHQANYALAWSNMGLMHFLVLGTVVAPVLEELLCRAYLYRALARDWHWLSAMVATSIVFGIYHSYFLHAFLLSIVLVCLYRRTASLRAPIYVHAFSNLVVWYPLLGQHLFPFAGERTGELSAWSLQLGALALASVAIPFYVWMSRDRGAAPTVLLEPHVALPK